ncbi:MAG: methylated-DNA--[Clostridia bacterium]|nr:methylated-DNA--[protein]-cysteine S-methyltransferase [Clostridia bacterium]MBR0445324.1 methylated-DNA--[protein]-cysteine S-methyltransferase [Clostridia bacterium]
MIYTNRYDSPLGNILLAGDHEGLTGLWFTEGGRYIGLGLSQNAVFRETSYFDRTKEWLDLYFEGRDPGFLPEIHLTGSAFRVRVCEIMLGIPFGKTATYGWIAERIAAERGKEKMSAQAVGGAVGHNPIGIIVPCHRVVGADGNLTGYGGGIWRKTALLKLEGVDTDRFTLPTKGGAL